MTPALEFSLRHALLEKRAELQRAIRTRDGIAVEPEPDAMDAVVVTLERVRVTSDLDRRTAMLRVVNEALGRMDSGEYGVCAECSEEIPAKRLAALPWAALCLRCAEAGEPVVGGMR